jgi:hypothetical protein
MSQHLLNSGNFLRVFGKIQAKMRKIHRQNGAVHDLITMVAECNRLETTTCICISMLKCQFDSDTFYKY